MAGFAKLFGSIVTSSVWCEDDATLRVWIAMLATCNNQGEVEGSIPGFANLARVTIPQMERAVVVLSSPDPHSRTPDHEGRRIVALPGGWRLLNYASYRDRGQGKDGSRAPYFRKRREQQRDVARNTEGRRQKAEAETETEPPLPPTGGADEVFSHWRSVMEHPTAKFTPGRKAAVLARLRQGYSVDQLKQAIDGCKRSDFHQGRPPASKDGKVFDDLTLICRNGENVERFGSLLTQAVVKATPLPRFKSRTERNEDEAREFLADKRRPS